MQLGGRDNWKRISEHIVTTGTTIRIRLQLQVISFPAKILTQHLTH